MTATNVIILSFFMTAPVFGAGVKDVCKSTGINVVVLNRRERNKNIEIIKQSDLGTSPIAKYLKDLYSKPNITNKDLDTLALRSNQKYIEPSAEKDLFLKFSNEKQKLADPSGYGKAVLDSLVKLWLDGASRIQWFLNLKNQKILKTTMRPAIAGETYAEYGATARINDAPNGKYELEIIYSNNSSEPLPYLLPLIAHELEHVVSYEEKLKIRDKQKYLEYQFIEEAKGNETQMSAYLALAKKEPDLFCNWMYVTWSYGDLLVPMSWTMASIESEMASGKFMFNYAKTGSYAGKEFLLNVTKTGLRPDIQKQIDALKLKYVK